MWCKDDVTCSDLPPGCAELECDLKAERATKKELEQAIILAEAKLSKLTQEIVDLNAESA